MEIQQPQVKSKHEVCSQCFRPFMDEENKKTIRDIGKCLTCEKVEGENYDS